MTDTPAIHGGVPDRGELSDGDLVRLARDGDPVAFRLLVERHQPMVRARARWLCPNHSDVDDVAQESFLHAFIALDRSPWASNMVTACFSCRDASGKSLS